MSDIHLKDKIGAGKPVAVVLGGSHPHKALIGNLKHRGFYTLLLDYYAKPPAAESADEHLCLSALDTEKVKSIAKERAASLVISVCLDRTIPVVAEVSKSLGLPSLYTPENAARFTDKALMKSVFDLHGIPSANGVVAESASEIEDFFSSGTLIIKPADSTGSLGIRLINNYGEISNAFRNAADCSNNGKVIAEEFLTGREFSVDCIVKNGTCHLLLVREKINAITADQGIQCVGTITPADLQEADHHALMEVISKVPKAFNLLNAPLLVQGILCSDGSFKILEIAVRMGGGASSFKTVQKITGFDLLNAAVCCNLDEEFDISRQTRKGTYSTINIYVTAGTLNKFTGIADLIAKGIVSEFFPFKNQGTVIPSALTARSRVCSLIITAPDQQALISKVKEMYDKLKVEDESGKNMVHPDLRLHLLLNKAYA